MDEELYTYAVTRVHINEQRLLSAQDMEQLIAAPTAAEAFRLLADKGWGDAELPANDADALVAFETRRTWDLISELMEDLSPFDVFRIESDYHNLKAAIKLAYSADDEAETGRYFLGFGTVPVETIVKAANEHDFTALPQGLADAGRAAYEALAHTGVGQACDMAIDRAALMAMDEAGKKAGSTLLKQYALLMVDMANIKSAVRSARMGKSIDFIRQAVAPAGTLDTDRLMAAAAQSEQAVYDYLAVTDYDGAVAALKISMAAFERWCNNRLIALIKPQRTNNFTIEPLAAYILARQSEIAMVRLILSAKQNHLSDDALRERLRDTYV